MPDVDNTSASACANNAWSSQITALMPGSPVPQVVGRADQRHGDAHTAAAETSPVDVEPAADGLDEFLHDREPPGGPAAVGGPEPWAVVVDLDDGPSVGTLQPHVDGAVRACGPDRVVDDVAQ